MAYFPPPEGATIDVAVELEQLAALSVGGLHDRYAEVFGEKPRSRHRQYLMRRIIWGLQANAEGGLSERARRRAAELADVADVRVTPPRWAFLEKDNVPPAGTTVRVPVRTDPRIPPPGSVIQRQYKGRTLIVTVLESGFEYLGQRYRSLTAVAKAVAGAHHNGFRFFNLGGKP